MEYVYLVAAYFRQQYGGIASLDWLKDLEYIYYIVFSSWLEFDWLTKVII